MIDIDLKDFATKDKLDRAMNRILKRIESKMRGRPEWIGKPSFSQLEHVYYHLQV